MKNIPEILCQVQIRTLSWTFHYFNGLSFKGVLNPFCSVEKELACTKLQANWGMQAGKELLVAKRGSDYISIHLAR